MHAINRSDVDIWKRATATANLEVAETLVRRRRGDSQTTAWLYRHGAACQRLYVDHDFERLSVRVVAQQQSQRRFSGAAGFGHGLEKGPRTFDRAPPAGAVNLPSPWFRSSCGVLNDDRKIGMINHLKSSRCVGKSAGKRFNLGRLDRRTEHTRSASFG